MATVSVDMTITCTNKKGTQMYKNADTLSDRVEWVGKGDVLNVDKKNGSWYRVYNLKDKDKKDSPDVNKPEDHVKKGWVKISDKALNSSSWDVKEIKPIRADVVAYEKKIKKDATKELKAVDIVTNLTDEELKDRQRKFVTDGKYESLTPKGNKADSSYQKKYKITKAQKADYDRLIKYNAPISDWKQNTANRIVRGVINANNTIKYNAKDGEEKNGETANWTNSRYVNLIRSIESNGLMFGPNDARDKYFNKFARINFLDPYFTTTNGVKEYLFFIKPDLNIVRVNESYHGRLVSYLAHDSFFVDLVNNHPDTVIGLQYSYTFLPFCNMLSACCVQSLDIPNIEADTMDTPKNIYGTAIEYRQDGAKSDENVSFNLEFRETKNRDVYYYFKAYEEYERKKKLGIIRPKYQRYITDKILHDQMGIFKIIVGEDMQTITHVSYICGVMPMDVPRGAYSEPDPFNILKYSISFRAAFIEDTKPVIFRDFNILQNKHKAHYAANRIIQPYDVDQMQINGEWAYAANVRQITSKFGDRFILEWYGAN